MRRVCTCLNLSYWAWLSVGPHMELEILLWRLWGGEGDNVIHTGFPEGEMQTLIFLRVWKFQEDCRAPLWKTSLKHTYSENSPKSKSQVSMWICHECRDCLYSRGNCCATTCVFYHQCFPVYPPHRCQNKLSLLCDNTWIIFYGNIPRHVSLLNKRRSQQDVSIFPQLPEELKPAFI